MWDLKWAISDREFGRLDKDWDTKGPLDILGVAKRDRPLKLLLDNLRLWNCLRNEFQKIYLYLDMFYFVSLISL